MGDAEGRQGVGHGWLGRPGSGVGIHGPWFALQSIHMSVYVCGELLSQASELPSKTSRKLTEPVSTLSANQPQHSEACFGTASWTSAQGFL